MINGIGADLIEKERIKYLFLKYGDRFVDKILTKTERKEFDGRKGQEKKISFLSNTFACKEAVSKALETGFSSGITLKNIEVLRKDSGSPYLNLIGKAEKQALERKCLNFKLSISDTKYHSLAFVIGEEK